MENMESMLIKTPEEKAHQELLQDVHEKGNEPFTPAPSSIEGLATPEEIIKASNGMSEKGPVTAEQLAAITKISAEYNHISPETQEVIDKASLQA